jgi:hypothetical protein
MKNKDDTPSNGNMVETEALSHMYMIVETEALSHMCMIVEIKVHMHT